MDYKFITNSNITDKIFKREFKNRDGFMFNDDKSIDNIGFWKRKAGIFREKAGFIGNIMQRACTISDKFKFF